jgi:Ca-activated chloride channel family protein
MPPALPDYYALLGLPRDATSEEIRRAYHVSALRLHPDVNVEIGDTELFLDIQRAFEVLMDPERKVKYDGQLPPVDHQKPVVEVNLLYSRAALPALTEPQLTYVLLELSPPRLETAAESAPLNVCLVLDRSTSMKGERMDMVKATAIEIIRQLRREDSISIVTFSDRAEVLVPANRRVDHTTIETQIQMVQTGGATEIYRGLEAGYQEIRASYNKKHINHVILLTDGRTYGDEAHCQRIADQASTRGVGISCLGIGDEWNDNFLDGLASSTGGSSAYIAKATDIRRILKEKFFNLSRIYAENVRFDFHSGRDIQLRYAFRIRPDSSPLETDPPTSLGSIPVDGSLVVVLEFLLPPLGKELNQVALANGHISVDIPLASPPTSVTRLRLTRPVKESAPPENPPTKLLNALSKLTLYRIQDRAHQAIATGDFDKATQHLNNLATNLFSQGEKDLARTVLEEAENLERGQSLSEEGKKRIKYGTRSLLLPSWVDQPLLMDEFGEMPQ